MKLRATFKLKAIFGYFWVKYGGLVLQTKV
jgi:hypothetical protein